MTKIYKDYKCEDYESSSDEEYKHKQHRCKRGKRGYPGFQGPQGATGASGEASIVQNYEDVVKSCVQYTFSNDEFRETCSGVFIRGSAITPGGNFNDLFILTANHCLISDESGNPTGTANYYINYQTATGDYRTGIVKVWAYNIRQDLALLKFINGQEPQNQATIQSVNLFDAEANNFKTGEPIMVIGNPLVEDEYSVTTGVIRESYFAQELVPGSAILPSSFSHTAPTYPGNSGGGVFLTNQGNQLAGIVSFGITEITYDLAVHPLIIKYVLRNMYANAQDVDVNLPGYTPYSSIGSWVNIEAIYPSSSEISALGPDYFDPTVSTRGIIYYGQFESQPQPSLPLIFTDLMRRISYPGKTYELGAGYPFLPFDFLFSLIPQNTTVTLTYRGQNNPPYWAPPDLTTTLTFIPMPAEFNKYLVPNPNSSTTKQLVTRKGDKISLKKKNLTFKAK